MHVTDIPFVKLVGIEKSHDGRLELPLNDSLLNHLQSIHASAQFALAETASGHHLQLLFPELVGKVVPVLRESQIKYKKPATHSIHATVSCGEETIGKFRSQFSRKGRAVIALEVNVTDVEGKLCSIATFHWFIQAL